MKLSCLRMMLFLVSCIVCFDKMASLNNRFVDAKTLQNFSDFVTEQQPKIIQTTHGDKYECVDFYKQPAFDIMSMKNHALHYEMRPRSSIRSSKTNNNKFGYLWKNGIGCPTGTIPIQIGSDDEMLRSDSFSKTYRPKGSWNFVDNQSNVDSGQHHFAVVRTKEGQGKIYTGSSMELTVHCPKVKQPQFSSSRMHVQIKDDYIQIGWTVNPKLYSDSKPRLYVYTKAGKNQCYNSMCSAGFISVRSDFPLGLVLDPSIRGGVVSYNLYSLLKDKANGNWWFKFDFEEIGFWPANRFKNNLANKIEWGGEVYSAFMPSPPMGYGIFPVKHFGYDAYARNITTVNENFEVDDWVKNTEAFSDNTRGYKVIDDIHSQFFTKHMLEYGGPGNI